MIETAIFLSSRSENLPILAGLGALAGFYFFYKGFRLLERKRLILNTPASKIRSAAMGLVEINGLAIGPYVLTSPLQQMECYYYRSLAWELKHEGKNNEWVKVAEETLHVPFYVDDNTDKVLVDPRGAEMDLHCDLQAQYHRSVLFEGPEMPGCVSEFLVRHAANPDKRIKVEEYCIKPKNSLFVLGTLSQNPGLDVSIMPSWAGRAGHKLKAASAVSGRAYSGKSVEDELSLPPVYGDDPPQVIRLSGEATKVPVTVMTQQQKIAAALMKAGGSSPAAWAAAGVGLRPKAVSAVLVNPRPAKPAPATSAFDASNDASGLRGFDLHPPVVLMQGSHNQAFFISWRSQRDVVNSLGWKSTLMIWGGPALTLISVYLLLIYFRWL